MTHSNELKRQRKRAARAELIRDSFEEAILKDLQNKGTTRDDEAARRAACKLYNDGLAAKVDALQIEIDALKKSAGNTADMDAAIAAKNAAEAELEGIKANLDKVLTEERKKVLDSVKDERIALVQREIAIKRKEEQMAVSTDAQLTVQAFARFHRLVKHIPMGNFFDHESGDPNSPYFWAAWMPMSQAKAWTAWESELMSMSYERQLFAISKGLHCMACVHHQRDQIDISPERKAFLEARLAFMGADAQNEVFRMNRDFSEQCIREPHPLSHHVDYDAGYRQNLMRRIVNEGLGASPATVQELPAYL